MDFRKKNPGLSKLTGDKVVSGGKMADFEDDATRPHKIEQSLGNSAERKAFPKLRLIRTLAEKNI